MNENMTSQLDGFPRGQPQGVCRLGLARGGHVLQHGEVGGAHRLQVGPPLLRLGGHLGQWGG